MIIKILSPCSPVSGREILTRLITLGKRLKLETIHLDDESALYVHPSIYGRKECILSLAYVRILLKGESWYQSFGFVSKQNADDREQNERVRTMPFRDFVKEVVEREKGSSNDAESFLSSLLKTFPEVNADMSVSDAIQKIFATINGIGETVCESHEFGLLKRLIDGCERKGDDGRSLLHYTYEDRVLHLSDQIHT